MTGSASKLHINLKNYVIVFILSSGALHFGYYTFCMNSLGKPIIEGVLGYSMKDNPDQVNTIYGMVNFVYSIGALIGSPLAGKLADRYGRRKVFYMSFIVDILNIVPLCIPHVAALMISRFISGFVTGVSSSIYSILLAEILPNKLCGIGGSLAIFFLTMGILLGYASQNAFGYQGLVDYWQVFMVYPLLLELLRVILFPIFIKTETPKYIFQLENHIHWKTHQKVLPLPVLNRHDHDESPVVTPVVDSKPQVTETEGNATERPLNTELECANEQLPNQSEGNGIGGQETTELNHDKAVNKTAIKEAKGYAKIREAYSHIYHESDLDKVVEEMIGHWNKQQAEGQITIGMRQLFTKKYRKQLTMGLYICFGRQMSGVGFLFFYSTLLFDDVAGIGKTMTLIIGITDFACSLITTFTVALFGRKPNLVVGPTMQFIGMLLLVIGIKLLNVPILIVGIILFVFGFTLGLGGTQMLYVSEVLPPVGVGVCFAMQWICTAIIGLLSPILMPIVGSIALIGFFMVVCLTQAVGNLLFLVETKNKTPREIMEEFNESWLQLCKKKKIKAPSELEGKEITETK